MTSLSFTPWLADFWMTGGKAPLVQTLVIGTAPNVGTPLAIGGRRFRVANHPKWFADDGVIHGVIHVEPSDGGGGEPLELSPFAGVEIPDGL